MPDQHDARQRVGTRTVAATAVFTAFVAAATSLFSVNIPTTNGYFNVGETMVYTAALLMGPYVGLVAGGAGSALSDLTLGYAPYAPGTLAIKGIEGFVVGLLATRVFARVSAGGWKVLTIVAAGLFAGLLAYVGTVYLSGEVSPVLGGVWGLPAFALDFQVPALFWDALAALAFALVSYFGLKVEPNLGGTVLSVLVGGAEMVAGYFLYEAYALQLGTASAAAEFPFNVAQALVGLAVAVPLSRSIRKVWGERMGRSGASSG